MSSIIDDATSAADKIANGSLSSRDLVQAALARIDELDSRGPSLHAVIETNPDAMEIADALDKERKSGKIRGPLHGIPILIKDNIATGDKMRTTCGSHVLEDKPATADAHLIKRLRDQGLVILGKANLSEWANFRSTRSTSGWSARGGLTRNPYSLDRTASGSSSGSAVAVAADYVALAVGTETDGSIISPAQINGIVGMKPTVGLISRHGLIPISSSQDTAGPMTRSVRDAAALLEVLAGVDQNDRTTALAPQREKSYTSFLNADGLKGARLGVVRELGEMPDLTGVFEKALITLKELGAEIIDPVVLPPRTELRDLELTVMQTEFKKLLPEWFAEFAPDAPVANLEEVISWNLQNAARELKFFAQERFLKVMEMGDLHDETYIDARKKCIELSRDQGIDKLLKDHKLDALVAPSGDPAGQIDLLLGDRGGFFFTSPAAVAGLPHLTVPMGFITGLPVGISFVGAAWSEGELLKFGYAFEQATQARKAPTFMQTLKFDL